MGNGSRINLPDYLAVLCPQGRALFTASDELYERGTWKADKAFPRLVRRWVHHMVHCEHCTEAARERHGDVYVAYLRSIDQMFTAEYGRPDVE